MISAPHHGRSSPRQFQFPKLTLALLVCSVLSSGCQQVMKMTPASFHPANLKLTNKATESDKHPVYELICLWEQGEGTGLDGLPCRGFTGQLMFFAHGIDIPVQIDGDIRIYIFDDQGTEQEQQNPIHQFNFDSSAVKAFRTETNIGTAYQMFLPYTRKGGQRSNCGIRVRYTPKSGNPVYSKMANIILPGTSQRKADMALTRQPAGAIQQVGHEVSADDASVAVKPTHLSGPTIQFQPQANTTTEDRNRLRSALLQSNQIPPEPTNVPNLLTALPQSAGISLKPIPTAMHPATSPTTAEAAPGNVVHAASTTNGEKGVIRLTSAAAPVDTSSPKIEATAAGQAVVHPLDVFAESVPANPTIPESTPPEQELKHGALKPVPAAVPSAIPTAIPAKSIPATLPAAASTQSSNASAHPLDETAAAATVSPAAHPLESE